MTLHDKAKKTGETLAEKPKSPPGNRSDENLPNDIQELRIRDEDLQALHNSSEAAASQTEKPLQSTRYLIRKQKSPTQPVKRKKVIIARNAPHGAELKPIDYSGPSGPRYDENGQIVSHSLVGSVDDFIAEAIRQKYIQADTPIPETPIPQHVMVEIRPQPRRALQKPVKIPMSSNQENALLTWQRQMAERKRQQGFISKLLQKPIDRLVMNQDNHFRETQEVRQLIDRAIPEIDSGKGYRVGSEFWRQHEQFGDDLTGIKMTLTKTEKGEPFVFEHIGKPSATRAETGLLGDGDEETVDLRRSWKASEYLRHRRQQLRPVMEKLDPLHSIKDITELQIIGEGGESLATEQDVAQNDQEQQWMHAENYDKSEVDADDPLKRFPDVIQEQVSGPSIVFGGITAGWTGSTNENLGHTGAVSRILFESRTGKRSLSHLELKNNGTTTIYYDWRKVPVMPSFEDSKQDTTQRFYFNTSEGAILPGEVKQFPFVFKSTNPGIFTETWQLLTEPVVLGGASLQVVLKGVATKEDTKHEERKKLLKKLTSREAEVTVRRLLNEIIRSIRTPERPSSPIDAYVTEEQIFEKKNPGTHYNYPTVLELKNFYLQLFPEETREEVEWDCSLLELKESILAVPDENAKEEMSTNLNEVVQRLSSKPLSPKDNLMYQSCYRVLQETLDEFTSCSMRIRGIMGLPEVVMEPIADTTTSVYSSRSYMSQSSAGTSRRSKAGRTGSVIRSSSAKNDKKAKGGKKAPPAKEDPKAKGKGGKKDAAKEKDQRPKSKGGKGKAGAAATPTKESPSLDAEISKTPSSAKAVPVDTMDPTTRKKYTEKMYSQIHDLLCGAFDKMDMLFGQIREG